MAVAALPAQLPKVVDVLVAGAGPAGAATAAFVRHPGLIGMPATAARTVLVAEARPVASGRGTNVAFLRPEGVRRMGWLGVLDEVPEADRFRSPIGRLSAVASIGRIEAALRARLPQLDVPVSYETALTGVRRLSHDLFQAELRTADGALHRVRAGVVVDASGGRAPLAARPAPTTRWQPEKLVSMHLPWSPAHPHLVRIGARAADGSTFTLFGCNSVVDGMSLFAAAEDAARGGEAASQSLIRAVREVGLQPGAVRPVLAPRGVDLFGRLPDGMLAVGDAVGHTSPAYGAGISLALEDAEWAAANALRMLDEPADRAAVSALHRQVTRAARQGLEPPDSDVVPAALQGQVA